MTSEKKDLETKLENRGRELFEARQLASRADESVKILVAQNDKLLDQVTNLAKELARNPEVLSEALLTGIATILNGYQAAATNHEEAVDETSMGALGLDNNGGVPANHFFPDVEFDEFMEGPHQWPTPGMMTTHSPVIPSEGQHPAHQMTPNGPMRTDGQPMFQAGTSGNPPVGGVES